MCWHWLEELKGNAVLVSSKSKMALFEVYGASSLIWNKRGGKCSEKRKRDKCTWHICHWICLWKEEKRKVFKDIHEQTGPRGKNKIHQSLYCIFLVWLWNRKVDTTFRKLTWTCCIPQRVGGSMTSTALSENVLTRAEKHNLVTALHSNLLRQLYVQKWIYFSLLQWIFSPCRCSMLSTVMKAKPLQPLLFFFCKSKQAANRSGKRHSDAWEGS